MSVAETTQFSGVAGRVLWGTMSMRSLVTGVLLGLTILISNWVLIVADAASFTTPLNHLVFAFVVARFVLNGQFGEWEGSVFSGAGGSWVDVIQVGIRYLTLTFVWLLPLIFIGLRPEISPAAMMTPKMLVLGALYIIASILTPPLMLIVSVAADNFADLFTARHWKELFSGRLVDLFAIYATYTGGMAMAVLLSAPTVIVAFAVNLRFGVVVASIALCFLLGMSLDLLGRLCGFFALGDVTTLAPASSEIGLSPAGASPQAGPTAATRPTAPARQPVPGPTNIATASMAGAPGAAVTAPPISTPKKPPLLNANEQVEQVMARFAQDPVAASSALEDLRTSYAPSPQVIAALCICQSRAGETDEALRLAGDALPLAFERGHSYLAVDIFKALRAHVGKLDLNREQILTIAGAAATKGDLSTAGEAYSMILVKDAGEIRAIKGLLQVAERVLREKNNPEVALRVYRFLEQRCSGSTLAEEISRGIAQAERRLASTPTPA
jgi:hypothetical protein